MYYTELVPYLKFNISKQNTSNICIGKTMPSALPIASHPSWYPGWKYQSFLFLPFSLMLYKWPTSKCWWWYCLHNRNVGSHSSLAHHNCSHPGLCRLTLGPPSRSIPNTTALCRVLIPEPRMAPTLLYPVWTTEPEIQGNLWSALVSSFFWVSLAYEHIPT